MKLGNSESIQTNGLNGTNWIILQNRSLGVLDKHDFRVVRGSGTLQTTAATRPYGRDLYIKAEYPVIWHC